MTLEQWRAMALGWIALFILIAVGLAWFFYRGDPE